MEILCVQLFQHHDIFLGCFDPVFYKMGESELISGTSSAIMVRNLAFYSRCAIRYNCGQNWQKVYGFDRVYYYCIGSVALWIYTEFDDFFPE